MSNVLFNLIRITPHYKMLLSSGENCVSQEASLGINDLANKLAKTAESFYWAPQLFSGQDILNKTGRAIENIFRQYFKLSDGGASLEFLYLTHLDSVITITVTASILAGDSIPQYVIRVDSPGTMPHGVRRRGFDPKTVLEDAFFRAIPEVIGCDCITVTPTCFHIDARKFGLAVSVDRTRPDCKGMIFRGFLNRIESYQRKAMNLFIPAEWDTDDLGSLPINPKEVAHFSATIAYRNCSWSFGDDNALEDAEAVYSVSLIDGIYRLRTVFARDRLLSKTFSTPVSHPKAMVHLLTVMLGGHDQTEVIPGLYSGPETHASVRIENSSEDCDAFVKDQLSNSDVKEVRITKYTCQKYSVHIIVVARGTVEGPKSISFEA